MPVRVTPDQFVITREGITHILAGAKWVKVGASGSEAVKLDGAQLDNDKDHPKEHNPTEVIKCFTSYGTKQNHS